MPRLSARYFIVVAFVCVPLLFASGHLEGEKNRYLVTGTYIDPGVMQAPGDAAQVWEAVIAPSLAKLVEWEKAGKMKGGIMVGKRQGTFIIDAPSNDKLDAMIQSLPFWPLLEWEIVPLTPFDHRLARDKGVFGAMKDQGQ